MKKKLLLLLFLIVGIFTITGCGTKESGNGTSNGTGTNASRLEGEGHVDELYFRYDSTYALSDTANGKMVAVGEYNVIFTHQKNKTIDSIVKEKKMTADTTKTINKIKWNLYDYSGGTVVSKIFMVEKDGGTYTVTFASYNADLDLTDIINEYMNEVYFQ